MSHNEFYNDKLKIFDLKANDLISSPLVITGEAAVVSVF